MVCHSLRFSPRYSQAKLSIDNKKIGELRHIYGRQNPNRTSVKRVHGKFNLSYWILPHDIDLMRWFLNDEVECALFAVLCGGIATFSIFARPLEPYVCLGENQRSIASTFILKTCITIV